jgi:hypothetical protein
MANKVDRAIETSKFLADYLKHLTTLATGSIVVIATLLEKLFSKPQWKGAVITSLLGFMISVLSSAIVLTMLALEGVLAWQEERAAAAEWMSTVSFFALVLTWMGFCVGIVCFTAFVIKNI